MCWYFLFLLDLHLANQLTAWFRWRDRGDPPWPSVIIYSQLGILIESSAVPLQELRPDSGLSSLWLFLWAPPWPLFLLQSQTSRPKQKAHPALNLNHPKRRRNGGREETQRSPFCPEYPQQHLLLKASYIYDPFIFLTNCPSHPLCP